MSRPFLFLLTALTLYFSLALHTPAHAWGAKGHQMVALIAERHLTEQARERLKQLLPKNGTLEQAATWPDRVRKIMPQMDPLHYVDVRRGSSYYDREIDCPQRNCIVEAINWYLQVLKSPQSPLAEKQIALNYIVHLVGDLHQPLHVGFLDDLGGTKTKVTFNGKEQTLHELWDSGIVNTENGSARVMANRLDQQFGADERKTWQAGTPKEWANESIALTTKYVYPLPESHEISEEYAKRALPILHKRLAQGGVRLAWLLNEALR
jgi:hypothetical protein